MKGTQKQRNYVTRRRTFLLAAANYYTLAAAVTICIFFLTWGVMQETGEQAPWIGAGLVAGMVLAGAVILREVFLRSHEQRRIRERKMLDASLRSALPVWAEGVRRKVTFEQNREWLAFIEERSRAAKVLGHLPEAH
ncbi:hypothetical protein J4558_25630 [Leptolyngbya sp. 15MV]|nr:hypothetical protein J4558_25630 [Leptolyngbya sp. 15MV]